MKEPIKTKIPSSDGVHLLSVTNWNDVETPKGVVQIVHGMKEHMGRYHDFAKFLNSKGFIAVGHDHLGHGNTSTPYGYFGKDNGANFLIGDVTAVTYFLREEFPKLPLFLLGHSMGSFVTRLSLLETSKDLTGYICMGTGGENNLMPFARGLARGISKIRGRGNQAHFMEYSMNKLFSRGLGNNELENGWLTRDPKVVTEYNNSLLSNFLFTNQGYYDLLDLQIRCNKNDWYEKVDEDLPILLVSGEEDPVGNYGKDIINIYNHLVDVGIKDIQFKLYEGARHEILNEINREVVYQDLLLWMEEQFS